jgi:rod shape-determining protein MreC
MTLRRRIIDYGIAGALLLLPAVLLHTTLRDPAHLTPFDQAVLRISSPLQAGVSWIVEGAGGMWNRWVWLVDVEDENDELRAENERLRVELREAARRARDAEVLERLAGLRERSSAETVGARVIAAGVNPYFRVARVRVDRGGADVKPGMPVINDEGLVGRIQTAYGEYSDVLLATDPQSSIDVYVEETGSRGVLRGLGRDHSYACKIEYLERGKEVLVGHRVVTSGLGGAFPPGQLVGTISAVSTQEYGLLQEVEVEPAIDYSSLRAVLVVLAPPPPPDPTAGQAKRSEAAFGVRPIK